MNSSHPPRFLDLDPQRSRAFSMPTQRSPVGNSKSLSARALCARALRLWETGSSFSDEILHRIHAETVISDVDRGFLTELFFGILRNLRALDFWSHMLRPGKNDPEVQALLRLGLYQIFFTRVPEHASVYETVALARQPARGVVNAVLRRALREKKLMEQALANQPAAVRGSHPDFLWERWAARWGESRAEHLCEVNNAASSIFFRVNTLRSSLADLLVDPLAAEYGASIYAEHSAVLRVQKVPQRWLDHGLGYVQDPSTLLAPDLLDPQPGESIFDACAAPGGKTTYVAQKMRDQGRVLACDLYESRLDRLRKNCARMGLKAVEIVQHDSLMEPEQEAFRCRFPFDRILLDVPCSNTGVLRRRVDVRWRLSEEDFLRMPVIQFAFVQRAFPLLKRGGVLVYSTCSIESEENEAVIERVVREFPELRLEEMRTVLPDAGGSDGAFAARFVRQ